MPQKAQTHHFPHSNTSSAANSPLISIQVDYSSRHNPRQPKLTDENTPHSTSNHTMKKKAVHRLPIPFAYTTPINHNDAPLPKIVRSKNLF
jgi:hypothetical protein